MSKRNKELEEKLNFLINEMAILKSQMANNQMPVNQMPNNQMPNNQMPNNQMPIVKIGNKLYNVADLTKKLAESILNGEIVVVNVDKSKAGNLKFFFFNRIKGLNAGIFISNNKSLIE